MKHLIIKPGTDNFVDQYPTELQLKPWQIRDLLKALVDHTTHAASKEEPFIFRMSTSFKIEQLVCPKCGSGKIIPILYGYIDESDDADDRDKYLLKMDREGKIEHLGCDESDGYNLTCKKCSHSWEWKLGYDWGKTVFEKEKRTC
jgi:hypothetical protein